ncbi:outer membrane beta-barrel protein [Crocinitomix algicola]|uniref:outer membrane beta-barrel protein n=1 Tax=Crocinitomix algicola TaxID=1740263 RepID=UPI000871B7C4|nr:outer membrane beta-barrel protein [Crocinitomix algicola]
MQNLKFLLAVWLCITHGEIQAQNVRLTGTVMAESETIDLGQIVVFNRNDSSLVKGSYLDSTYFSMVFNSKGRSDFYAKITLPEYLDTLVDFTVIDTVVELGSIVMTKNKDLETVDVVFRKEMFKRTMDGVTVNVEGTNLQSLTNLFEVLKASPKITSPDDETIEIIGKGSPLILVDRQAIISNDELKAIPASQIERIEIITNPSAKYKAEGSGNGVIEVFTKDFHLEGYNMTIRTSFGMNTRMYPQAGLNAGISMKKKKFSLNGYLGGNYSSKDGYGESFGISTDDTNREIVRSNNFENNNVWQYYSIKGAYRINDRQKLAAGINGYGSIGMYDNSSNTDYLMNNVSLSSGNTASISEWTWLNNSAFINYTVDTDTNKSNFSVNLNYVNKVDNSFNESLSQFESPIDGSNSEFNVQNVSKNIPNVGELRVNYEHYFDTTGWKLNVGGSYNLLLNTKSFDRYNRLAGTWTIDDEFSNSYDYQEHIGAVFAEVSKKWDKWGGRLGVRTEYTRLDGYSYSLEKQFMDSAYILPFPTASLMYEPTENVALTMHYKAGINRPEFSNFDPFIRVNDSLSISYGNPFLRPAIRQSIGLDLDLFYAYSLSLGYNYTKEPTSELSFISDDSFVEETTPWNALYQEGLSASLTLPFQLDWLQGYNSIWVDYDRYVFTDIFERDPFNVLTYGVYSYLTFILPHDINIMNRLSVSKWGGDRNEAKPMANWGLRVTKKYKGGNFQLFGEVANIVPPKYRSTVYAGNYQYQTMSQNDFTTFKIGLFLKFGRLKAPTHIEESKSGQSDRL